MSLKTKSSPYHNEKAFLAYPINRLFGVVNKQEQADKILEGLYALGYSEKAVNVATGQEAADRVDLDGSHSGLRGRVVRAMQHLGGEYAITKSYEAATLAGQYVVAAPIDNDEDKAAVVALFKENGAENMAFFKKNVVEDL